MQSLNNLNSSHDQLLEEFFHLLQILRRNHSLFLESFFSQNENLLGTIESTCSRNLNLNVIAKGQECLIEEINLSKKSSLKHYN